MRFAAINEILLMPCLILMIFRLVFISNKLRFIFLNFFFLLKFKFFSGRAGIFIPFVYYRFLCLRYQSRRNPYNRFVDILKNGIIVSIFYFEIYRQAFYEMRITAEYYSQQPKCPQMVRNIALKAIAFICRLAPQQ